MTSYLVLVLERMIVDDVSDENYLSTKLTLQQNEENKEFCTVVKLLIKLYLNRKTYKKNLQSIKLNSVTTMCCHGYQWRESSGTSIVIG